MPQAKSSLEPLVLASALTRPPLLISAVAPELKVGCVPLITYVPFTIKSVPLPSLPEPLGAVVALAPVVDFLLGVDGAEGARIEGIFKERVLVQRLVPCPDWDTFGANGFDELVARQAGHGFLVVTHHVQVIAVARAAGVRLSRSYSGLLA